MATTVVKQTAFSINYLFLQVLHYCSVPADVEVHIENITYNLHGAWTQIYENSVLLMYEECIYNA